MDRWHYPRIELAEHYLRILDIGILSNLAIIAPRRKGKTLFVLQDVTPVAQNKQYIPIYASLWQNIDAPQEGLILALEEMLEALDKRAPLTRLFNAKIKKTAVSNELLGKMEVEFADSPTKATHKELSYIEKLLNELEKKAGKKKILLLVDEIQHLATSKSFDPLTYALRTMLDKRQGRIKAIYTGSSRHYMNQLFNESDSPFYHFVEAVTFPDLDEQFVEFLRARLVEDHGIAAALQPLNDVFKALDFSPYWMMKLIGNMVTFKMSVATAREHVFQLLEVAEGLEAIAKKMKPVDRIVFLALCDGKNPFSKELMARIEKETDVKGAPANIQRAIKRLSENHLISQIYKGEYFVEKPGLKHYLVDESRKI